MNNIVKCIITAIVSVLICAAIGISLFLFVLKPKTAAIKTQAEDMQNVLNDMLKTVYITTEDLSAGDVLTADCVYVDSRYLQGANYLISEADIGKILSVDVPANEVMMTTYLFDTTSESKDNLTEYSCFTISSAVKKDCMIDVRIRFQNGEDYIVLAGKKVQNADYTTGVVFLNVSATETQLMASAITDTQTLNANMYCTVYPYGGTPKVSMVNYPISKVNGALTDEYNTEEAAINRDNLVKRLALAESELVNYQSDINNTDTADVSGTDFSNTNDAGSEHTSGFTDRVDINDIY